MQQIPDTRLLLCYYPSETWIKTNQTVSCVSFYPFQWSILKSTCLIWGENRRNPELLIGIDQIGQAGPPFVVLSWIHYQILKQNSVPRQISPGYSTKNCSFGDRYGWPLSIQLYRFDDTKRSQRKKTKV